MKTIKQKLTKGKALCGKVFRNFVPTFNWLVDFASNLKGDGDANNGQGHITVDKSDEDHPIIRCSGCGESAAYGVASIEGEQGDTFGSDADKLTGEVEASGASGSGLVVKSTSEGGLVVDIASRDTSGSYATWGIRKLYYTDSNGNEVILAKFLGTANVNIGQEGGDEPLSGTILSDVSLTYSNGELTLTKTTKDLATGETTPATSTVFTTVAHSTGT